MTTHSVPKPEYPRPQFTRRRWLNLNGVWDFEIDQANSGLERGLLSRAFTQRILVPFAPESTASGIGNSDFLEAVWYRKDVVIPTEWSGCDVLLHFGAVDHDATVWVNGTEVARHTGGFTPFTANLSGVAEPGQDISIVVRARDSHRGVQARGKQATWLHNTECYYTRTTGIWQTVWLEPVSSSHLTGLRIVPDVDRTEFRVTVDIHASKPGQIISAELSYRGEPVARDTRTLGTDLSPQLTLAVPAQQSHLWTVEQPHLYDLRLTLLDAAGQKVDEVGSYTGLRSISINGHQLLLNGRPVFQRLVLDQGYWPDTLMTSATDADLIRDIELAKAAGFNGARLHQKVFEERYLYHADRLGLLLWAEFADWGAGGAGRHGDNQRPSVNFVAEWLEVLRRDFNHPAIVGWCPLNETHQVLHDRPTVLDAATKALFDATKATDPTRPVIDASGYSHRVAYTDVWDSHCYEQDVQTFADNMSGLADGQPFENRGPNGEQWSLPYRGQPYLVSEYGGIWWSDSDANADGTDREQSWGYGRRPATVDDWFKRFQGLTDVLLDNPLMFGYCYTQLTDVFQEKNGLYTFDRSPKFDIDRIRQVQARKAAYEEWRPQVDIDRRTESRSNTHHPDRRRRNE
jgi:beta-galactosidase/beta-glucuronidase